MRPLPLLLLLAGCGVYDPLYLCQRSEQCVDGDGLAGRCVEAACAWPAPDCPSGLRFDDSAGPDRGGGCTPVAAPEPTAAPFTAVALPGGAADAPRLGPLFGHGAAVYAVGWDGDPFLLRLDGAQAARGPLPTGSDPIVAATASPSLLALATADRLFLSPDGGASFLQRDEAGVQALHHDGQLLHLLRGGQVESLDGGGARIDTLTPAEGAVLSLSGSGAVVLAIAGGDRGAVYLRDGAWRRVFLGEGPLSAGAPRPGGFVAAGPGHLVLDGAAVQPAPAAAPRQIVALSNGDLWLRGEDWPRLLLRRAGEGTAAALREVAADADAAGYTSLWAGDAGPWIVSRFAADRTYRSRLWRGPAP